MLSSDPLGELPDLSGELSCPGLIEQSGQGGCKPGALSADPRPDQKTGHRKPKKQQRVNDRDRPDTAVDKFFQPQNRRIYQVGKENREEKEKQGSARRIEKANAQGEQQGREQNAGRA